MDSLLMYADDRTRTAGHPYSSIPFESSSSTLKPFEQLTGSMAVYGHSAAGSECLMHSPNTRRRHKFWAILFSSLSDLLQQYKRRSLCEYRRIFPLIRYNTCVADYRKHLQLTAGLTPLQCTKLAHKDIPS